MRGFLAPRASIVIAGHNEGDLLVKTVRSCLETSIGLGCEVVVADDASTDGSTENLSRCFPEVRVVRHRERLGCSPAKDLGGRSARGNVLLFIDAHCKPDPWALERLINDVEDSDGRAIVTPRVPVLDCEVWENSDHQLGHGYRVKLDTFETDWIGLEALTPVGRFYECPALMGCCLAISRKLYVNLGGFDKHMLEWGSEDVDLGLRAWQLGHQILHDPDASIGHRFRSSFENFTVTNAAVLTNQLRMARKNFSEETWEDWVERNRPCHPRETWEDAWSRFTTHRQSAERARSRLLSRRVRDEYAYAERYGLDWPHTHRPAN